MKKIGWVTLLTALMLALGSLGSVQAEILPPYGEGQIGLQAVVLCETLTVRKEARSSSKAMKTLHYGDRIIVQPQTGGWAQCFLTDAVDAGPDGWVNEDYLAIDPAWYRTEETTPVYAWNDRMAPKVALLDKNTTLPILKDEGNWLIVSLRGATGWIYRNDYVAETIVPEAPAAASRRDGDRFEDTIMLEGMEETVRYEHAVNTALGIEIDYDYESFERHSGYDRELFVSRYDDPQDPMNYLEVKYSAENADAVRAAISAELAETYEITIAPYTLSRAGSCVQIDASCVKGTNLMHDILQTVYIIPAADGCIVATSHCPIESGDGFHVRISYILNSLVVTRGGAE